MSMTAPSRLGRVALAHVFWFVPYQPFRMLAIVPNITEVLESIIPILFSTVRGFWVAISIVAVMPRRIGRIVSLGSF